MDRCRQSSRIRNRGASALPACGRARLCRSYPDLIRPTEAVVSLHVGSILEVA